MEEYFDQMKFFTPDLEIDAEEWAKCETNEVMFMAAMQEATFVKKLYTIENFLLLSPQLQEVAKRRISDKSLANNFGEIQATGIYMEPQEFDEMVKLYNKKFILE